MPEKPKITLKELSDIYDIEEVPEDSNQEDSRKTTSNSEFDVYTEDYDKEDSEKALKDVKNAWKVEEDG